MTEAVQPPLRESHWHEHGLVAGVSLAHFISHFYFMVLPPLFLFIRSDYNVSYTELGLVLSVFSTVSTIFQTPVGFLVDRTGPRANLIGGLLLGGASLVVVGLSDSYWMLVAMFGVLGLANTVFHPADYAMLSHHVPAQRIARAFSVHTFSGLLGGAVAPATLLFLQLYVGWRGAIIAAGLLGLIGAVILMLQRDPPLVQVARPKEDESARPSGWQLLTSRPMLLNLVFFFLVSTIASGLTNYLVVALIDLQNAPVAVANTALSTIMFASAVGVLLGGLILTRTRRHVGLTYITLSVIGTVSLIVAYVSLDAAALIVMMILSGLASGVMSPSRDMMVRDITPPGSFGAVFGFLSNGFSLSGIVSPLLFGFLMDHGQARYVFVVVAASCLLCALAVTAVARSGPARSLPDPSPR